LHNGAEVRVEEAPTEAAVADSMAVALAADSTVEAVVAGRA
jgi:hypothetical protein